MEYLATFDNHTQAMGYARVLQRQGIPVGMMPRPRILAASCGTAVRFRSGLSPATLRRMAPIQQLYYITGEGYRLAE